MGAVRADGPLAEQGHLVRVGRSGQPAVLLVGPQQRDDVEARALQLSVGTLSHDVTLGEANTADQTFALIRLNKKELTAHLYLETTLRSV